MSDIDDKKYISVERYYCYLSVNKIITFIPKLRKRLEGRKLKGQQTFGGGGSLWPNFILDVKTDREVGN